jgi:hypothetical protein
MSSWDREVEVKRLTKLISSLFIRAAAGDLTAKPALSAAIARRRMLDTVEAAR